VKRLLSFAFLFFLCALASPLFGGWSNGGPASNTKTSATTPPIGRVAQASISNPDAGAALNDIKIIASTLHGLNASGLKTVAADSDFQNAVGDLRNYLAAAGQAGWKVLLATGNPQDAIIAAGVAGQLEDYESTAVDVVQAVHEYQAGNHSQAAANGINIALDKLAGKIADDIAKQSGISSGTPTPVFDAAKIGARFIMAYESGVLHSVAPNGFAPLLDKNPTTKNWLTNINSYLQSSSTQQRPAPGSVQQYPTQSTALGAGNVQPKQPTSAYPTVMPAAPQPIPAGRTSPGGISLSEAAAKRMPLDIALDAVSYRDGVIVLSGKHANSILDAALFFTTLRAACEDQDLYFSLDPDDGRLWQQQGEQAYDALWERIKKNFESVPTRGAVDIRTVSASRDYPEIWRQLATRYPNFRSKLVFAPEWLRQTRVGEILYKADVLLKELASGVPVVAPGKLRASSVEGYLPAEAETVARNLLSASNSRQTGQRAWRGSRLWFDLVPAPPVSTPASESGGGQTAGDARLVSVLRARGLIRISTPSLDAPSIVVRDGNVVDLSSVRPRMFVRVHDFATNRDLSNHDPDLDGLATDVSARFDIYASAYDELQNLREVFRAYVAAVRLVENDERLCDGIDNVPLLSSERPASLLPDYQPSELFVTVGTYLPASASHTPISTIGSFINGGVSVAGRQFLEMAEREGKTSITEEMRKEIAGARSGETTDTGVGRIFIRLRVDDLIRSKRVAAAFPRTTLDGDIENEPPAAALPQPANSRLAWLVLFLVVMIGLAISQRNRSMRGKWR
jgi:hypothetical protein